MTGLTKKHWSQISDSEAAARWTCFGERFMVSDTECTRCMLRDRCVNAMATRVAGMVARRTVAAEVLAYELETDTPSIQLVLLRAAGTPIRELLPPPNSPEPIPAEESGQDDDDPALDSLLEEASAAVKIRAQVKSAVQARGKEMAAAVPRRPQRAPGSKPLPDFERERKRSLWVGSLQPGTVLFKRYRGQEVVVEVAADHYLFAGKKWPTLYSIIFEVTSKHRDRATSIWSAQRFFARSTPPPAG